MRLAFFAVLLLLAGGRQIRAQGYTGDSAGDAELSSLMLRLRQQPYDRIPAIDHPEFVPAEEAHFLQDPELVVGVEYHGVAKAYPVKFLNGREVVNDSLGSGPITVTW